MTKDEEPLDFYAPEISKAEVKNLSRRNNSDGLLRTLSWSIATLVTGTCVVLALHSPFLILAVIAHGCFLSFSYAPSHECAHGTAFKSRWLNETIFWITSLIYGEEPVYRRYSHTSHHSYTWFRDLDAQMPYHNPVTFSRYVLETSGAPFLWGNFRLLVLHSFGRVSQKVQGFVPEPERRRMRVNSAFFLTVYASLIATAFAFQTLLPLLLYFLPRALGGWLVNLYVNTQHMCMQEGIADHRYTTRSIRCSKLSRWIYWNMNFHIEHHLFPMVPFHSLPQLRRRISSELPVYRKGVIGANVEIVQLISRQSENPYAAALPTFRPAISSRQ